MAYNTEKTENVSEASLFRARNMISPRNNNNHATGYFINIVTIAFIYFMELENFQKSVVLPIA